MTRTDDRAFFDELLDRTQQYQSSVEYLESLRVVAALRGFSPFNAYLLRIQRPQLRFAAPLERWQHEFGRTPRTDRPVYPLVILRPFGPVDFVFDLDDTDGPPLPRQVLEPFRASGYVSSADWERLFRNTRRRGVQVDYVTTNLLEAGWIEAIPPSGGVSGRPPLPAEQDREQPPIRYRVVLNGHQTRPVQFVTLLHELGHLACGHLGGQLSDDWPDRNQISQAAEEFEAESVAFIVSRRLGLESHSEEYLAAYVQRNAGLPAGVSIYTVLKAAGLLQEWTSKLSWPRKPRKEAAERTRRMRREHAADGRD